MATLTIQFIQKHPRETYQMYDNVECVKTIKVVGKKVKSDQYKEAYYCHENELGIKWVVCSEGRYGESWGLSSTGKTSNIPNYTYIVVKKH